VECDGCDFSFDVESVTTDDRVGGCDLATFYTFQADLPEAKPNLTFTSNYVYAGYYADYYITNWVTSNYVYDYYGYEYAGGVNLALTVDYGDGTPVSSVLVAGLADNVLTIEGFDETPLSTSTLPEATCDSTTSAEATERAGNYIGGGVVPCDGTNWDVWSLASVAGQTYTISLDNADAETAADLVMYVFDNEEECYLGQADDSFDCAFLPPSGYACPSLTIEGDGSALAIFVANYGDCTGDNNYELYVSGTGITPPSVELFSERWESTIETPQTLEYSFVGNLTPSE
jgi:hypothetical protein